MRVIDQKSFCDDKRNEINLGISQKTLIHPYFSCLCSYCLLQAKIPIRSKTVWNIAQSNRVQYLHKMRVCIRGYAGARYFRLIFPFEIDRAIIMLAGTLTSTQVFHRRTRPCVTRSFTALNDYHELCASASPASPIYLRWK